VTPILRIAIGLRKNGWHLRPKAQWPFTSYCPKLDRRSFERPLSERKCYGRLWPSRDCRPSGLAALKLPFDNYGSRPWPVSAAAAKAVRWNEGLGVIAEGKGANQ